MRWRWRDGSWIGRGALRHDFYDLAIADDEPGDDPPAAALAQLEAVDADSLIARAVAAVCAARQADLGWREGPPLEDWSLVELRIARDGALWVTVHEYETDEYSLWMVAFGAEGRPGAVRRRPYVPVDGDPTEAGVQLSGTP